MKKFFLTLFIALLFFYKSFSQKEMIPVQSSIKNVTIFLNGAQVTRITSVSLKEGNNLLILYGLPSDVNPNSIQIGGTGNFTILSFSTSKNFLVEKQKEKNIQLFEDSIARLKDIINEKNTLLTVYNQEESLLLSNKQLAGQNTGLNITALKEATDFFRNRLIDIKTKQNQLNKQINELQKQVNKLEQQINQKNVDTNTPSTDILLSVWAEKPCQAKLELSYITNLASWIPYYDLKVKDLSSPMEFIYKASVAQYTNEDWDNIKVTLSTANPIENANKPEYKPWFLSFYEPIEPYNSYTGNKIVKGKLEAAPMQSTRDIEIPETSKPTFIANYVSSQENITNFEYIINKNYSIPSNNQPITIQIKENKVNALYEYYAYPKKNSSAFLIAKVTGIEDLNLTPGEINLYFENSYIGKTYYNGINVSDTLEFSLGQDKNISIKREKLKDYSSKKIIGLNQKQSIGIQISIKNNKTSPVLINLFDQIPLSTNKEIEVEINELSGGKYNETDGSVFWKVSLAPGESKKFTIIYTVKYPKDKTVILE